MTDTTAAHALLWDAWADVQRLDHYALGVLGALIAAPRPGLSRDVLAEAGGVPRAIVDHAIDQLAAHGYVDRLRAVAPYLAGVLDGSPVRDAVVAPEPSAVRKPAQAPAVPPAVRWAFSIATDAVLDALDALEDAPLALEGPSLAELEQVARDRLRGHSEFSGADLESLAAVVAGHVWARAAEDPEERRQNVLETLPRVLLDPRQVIEPEMAGLVYGRRNPESVLIACRSIYAEANARAVRQRLETATAPDPLDPEQLEAAATAAAQRVADQRAKNPNKPSRATSQKSGKPQTRRRRAAPVRPTAEEIEAARTEKGGYNAATLAQWGVPWPPPKGWKQRLLAQNEET